MDTKHLENIGETIVINTLLEAGILVAKPFFDQAGADLIGITSVNDRTRICRIQCKYRELKTRTSVVVDSKYIAGAFVLFLYLKTSGGKSLFCFLPKDIHHFFRQGNQRSKKVFRLSLTSKTVVTLTNEDSLRFNSEKVADLNKLIQMFSPDSEIRRIMKDVIRTSREITSLQKKRAKLQSILHEIEVLELEKEANEEKIEILQDYVQYMESQVRKRGTKNKSI